MAHLFNTAIIIVLIGVILYLIGKSSRIQTAKTYYSYVINNLLNTSIPMCIINLHTNKINTANEAFCNFIGKSSINHLDIIDSGIFDDYNEYKEIKEKCKLEEKEMSGYTISCLRKNGNKKIFRLSYNTIKIGYREYLLLTIDDKTNLVNYVKKLGIFTKIADNNKDGIIVVNLKQKEDGKNVPIISYANDSIGNITGYNVSEVLNKPLSILFENNVDEKTLDDLYDNLNHKDNTTIEYQYIKRDGTICWIQTNIVPVVRQSILDKLLLLDTDSSLEDLKELDIYDFDIYITLYQKDITDDKNMELPTMACIERLSTYNKSTNKFFDFIDGVTDLIVHNGLLNDNLETILKLIGEAANADKCYIFKILDKDGTKKMQLHSLWDKNKTEIKHNLKMLNNLSFEELGCFKFYTSLILNKPYSITINEAENVYTKEMLKMNNINSFLAYPIVKNNDLIGFIAIDSEEIMNWNENINTLLSLISDKLKDTL